MEHGHEDDSAFKTFWTCFDTRPAELVRIRRVIIGISYLYRDASVKNVCSDTLRLKGSPIKSRRKVVLLSFKKSIQLGCVSQDYPPKESILRKVGKLGSNLTVKFSRGTWHHKKSGKKRQTVRQTDRSALRADDKIPTDQLSKDNLSLSKTSTFDFTVCGIGTSSIARRSANP